MGLATLMPDQAGRIKGISVPRVPWHKGDEVPTRVETWPIIERERERIPDVPPDLSYIAACTNPDCCDGSCLGVGGPMRATSGGMATR